MKFVSAASKEILQKNNKINSVKKGKANSPKQKAIFKEMETYRGRPLFFENLLTGNANGPYVEMVDGSVKLDFITGIGVNFLGYHHPKMIKAQLEGVTKGHIYEGHLVCSDALINFMKKMVQLFAKDTHLKHCFPAMTGAMANENAIKIAFHNSPGRDEIVVFKECFHGRTHLLAQMTDNPSYRVNLPTPFKVHHIPFYDEKKPKESLMAFEKLAKKKKVAVIGCELIQGEGGYIGAPKEYFMALFKIAKKYGVKVWVDEIQTGGRMINTFRYRDLGLGKLIDILTLGKMTQVCATLYTKELNPKAGLLSQTYAGSSCTLKAANVVIDLLNNKSYYGKNKSFQKQSDAFAQVIKDLQKKYPDKISNFRYYGGMYAFKILDGSADITKKFQFAMFEAGIIGFFCGHGPYFIRFLPPLPVLTKKHLKEAKNILSGVLEKFEGK